MKRSSELRLPVIRLALALLVICGTTAPSLAVEAYDLLFKTGTLDGISRTSVLDYHRTVAARGNDDLAARNTGTVSLSFAPDQMAMLQFRQGDKHRTIGSFPATVGNPMIMYFVETVIRDMASSAGGSPFYIRNRVKAALVEQVPVREVTLRIAGREIPARSVTLYPFRNDPNRERMKGFENLALTVTMSEAVPGWYYSLEAQTGAGNKPGAGDPAPVYSSSIVLGSTEVTR